MTISTGTMTGGKVQQPLQVLVEIAVSPGAWTGSIRPCSAVSPDKMPQPGWMYRLRLDDDRERYISINSVTPLPTSFTAVFTGVGPPPHRNTHLKRPPETNIGRRA